MAAAGARVLTPPGPLAAASLPPRPSRAARLRTRPAPRRLSSGAPPLRASLQVSGPGSIDSPQMAAMQAKIKEALEAQEVVVKDAYGDGRHVSIHVVSPAFEGLSSMNRQRMVYKAIWEELQSTVHAVDSMTTKTPSEVEGTAS